MTDSPEVRIDLLGIRLHPMNAAEVADLIGSASRAGEPLWIANYNLHALYLHLKDSRFREAYRKAGVFLVDGWPILQLARIASRRKLGGDRRVGSSDWLDVLLESGERRTIVSIGASPESARFAAERVEANHPNVVWMGFDGYRLEPQSSMATGLTWQEAVRKADVVLVGRGMPTQEYWIAENIGNDEFAGKVVANVGGCIDYLSGAQDLAPRWTGRCGVEWLYRLARSPRRLAFRYLVEPVLLMVLVVNVLATGERHRVAGGEKEKS
ncbi:WecB/TagA/CpsF family glycosyltransferase [Rhodococcus sp. NPDC003382]|uniref:WecB/TagA/CpsF family glycosyltransferase n=1 Tax=Rhodococcus sp. HM1 TaxID=2937759 RepID=UPI00200B5F00|nr:WecB/TagA/CpsF family glycosyltransferase [Rhodococcus sp. HM1]MCK8671924.1 WecB/TagA/CpsF family glycosyltransferase [Rhodococcus sp. HM1]